MHASSSKKNSHTISLRHLDPGFAAQMRTCRFCIPRARARTYLQIYIHGILQVQEWSLFYKYTDLAIAHLDTSWHILTHLQIYIHCILQVQEWSPFYKYTDLAITQFDTIWHILTHLDTSSNIHTWYITSTRVITLLQIYRSCYHTSWHNLTHLDTFADHACMRIFTYPQTLLSQPKRRFFMTGFSLQTEQVAFRREGGGREEERLISYTSPCVHIYIHICIYIIYIYRYIYTCI